MQRMISILLVDDQGIVRTGMKHILDHVPGFKVIGEASSGEEALQVVRKIQPEVVLMDIRMPGMGGLEATRKLLQFDPHIKVLVVTALEDDIFPSKLLETGAVGYVTKGASAEEMVRAIKIVYAGQRFISPFIAQQMALKGLVSNKKSTFDSLSARELQIALMIIDGKTVREIANKLFVSPKTVNSYRYRIFDKLDIKSNVALTLLAIRQGLVDDVSKGK